jgi:RimJ/RimL family protein N-acetyltransferase
MSPAQRLIPPSIVETPRLYMRRPILGDADHIFCEYATDPEVTRYLTWSPHQSIEDTRAFLRAATQRWEEGAAYDWVICPRDEGKVVGMVGCRVAGHKAELGYVLARRLWGQGIMPEAAAAIMHWAIAQPAIRRVWAVCDVGNLASARVLEKIGMQPEGILRHWLIRPSHPDEPRDCLVYSIVR